MDSFITKLTAFFAAIYFFLLCLPYGNQPVKVELTYEVKTAQTTYTDGDRLSIQTYAKNVGRPYYGHVSSFCMTCSVFQTVDGERQALSTVPHPHALDAVVDQETLIKHGDVQFSGYEATLQNAVPGWYSLEVVYEIYDGTQFSQVFENVFEVQ